MANYVPCLMLQRVVVPLIIVLCSVVRPVGIALAYLFMFFITPFVPVANSRNIKGPVGAYFIILIALSTILLVGHIGLQIAVVVLGPENVMGECTFTEILLRHIGFISLDHLHALAITEWIGPDVVMFLTSIIFYVLLRKLTREEIPSEQLTTDGTNNGHHIEEGIVESRRKAEQLTQATIENMKKIGPLFSLITLFLASAFRPSVPGGFYFLVFISTATYWACFKPLQRGFAIILRFVMLVLVIHVIAILSYQTPWPQDQIANSSLAARLTALEPLFISKCTLNDKSEDIRIIDFNREVEFDSYLSPISMLLCYYVLALTSSVLMKKKVLLHRDSSSEPPTERTPLVRRNTKRQSAKRSGSTEQKGSEISGAIPLDALAEPTEDEEQASSIFDQILFGIYSTGGFIYQNSYIFTNITMMVWSIIYHSWLTFLLLIWANILWMIPNQRKTMLRTSPFIVLYAELLLIAQYIYGMNLTDDELPTTVQAKGINLRQIGFIRPDRLPCVPLINKTLFTTMFWITLRQLFKEEKEKKQSSTLADMVAPLQITVGAATADLAPKPDAKKSSKFLEKTGQVIKTVLVKLWIWLLISVIFLSAITGHKMTGFRICYMALFLFFVLAFQLSWKAWTKIMYGFWLVLIFYAMSILLLVYTYQFDKFDIYWHEYLHISTILQGDIGLQQYATKDLFLHLVNPTAIVIMTVIQVHYFHKRFLASLETAGTTDVSPMSNTTSANFGPRSDDGITPDEPPAIASAPAITEKEATEESELEECGKLGRLSSFRRKSRRQIGTFFQKVRNSNKEFIEFIWVSLEVHLLKIVYICAFVCCVTEVCVLHVCFAFLSVIALMSKTKAQIYISRLIGVIVSALLLSKMIYQIDYINHSKYNVTCDNNATDYLPNKMNNADWFGLQKLPKEKLGNLSSLVKGYILYMVILTVHAVVVFRQAHMRARRGVPNIRPHLIFPGIIRKDAEKDLLGLIQYLFNYGYYKFGIEVTLITLVSLISYRQDVIAILYAVWLCILFMIKRELCAKFWPAFQWFTAVIIPLQYLLFVGLPPGLCLLYPWHDSPLLSGLQSWAMLPGPHLSEQSKKLLFDFMLLLFICRQSRVFSLEKRFEATSTEFPGGTNKSIIMEIENLGVIPFENPTPDFIANVRNWLDILKVAILTGFFWFTLAVVFLAGTNIVSLFSIGYLVGSFVFLWQGTDFYLRPIGKILKWWYMLLAYNVAVIAIKTTLQIAGCLFLSPLKQNVCWFVHFMGVSCIRDLLQQGDILDAPDPTQCRSSKDVTGLTWDAICFAFLLLQLRIFNSYYFCHIINDTKASTILASRGAELIEDLRRKQIQFKAKHEREVLRKIKKKMEKIRATQQKMMRPIDKPTHFDEEATAPLARSSSMSSCHGSGYHTPIEGDDDDDNIVEVGSEIPSDLLGLLPSQTGSTLQTQAPSPSSAVMTVSLEGYLEPQRLSFGSPPNSELLPRVPSSDDSFPVFSPPPYDSQDDSNTLVPPSSNSLIVSSTTTTGTLPMRQHRRQSSMVSWNERVELSKKSGDSTSPCDGEDRTPLLRHRSLYRRQSSMGNASSYLQEEPSNGHRRRYSNLSWAHHEDSMSTRTAGPRRPYSWGPIEHGFPVGPTVRRKKPPKTHPDAIRAGDYYMFDDLDEKIELDLMDEESDFLEAQGEISASELKMSKRKNLLEVYKDIEKVRRKQMQKAHEEMLRRKSYSAPTSKIGAQQSSSTAEEQIYACRSTLSDPLPIIPMPSEFHEKDEKSEKTPKTPEKPVPSTSKGPPSDDSKKKSDGEGQQSGLDSKEEKAEEEAGLIPRLIEGLLVSFAIRLNRLSRNYRYVMKILANEKKLVKESEGFGIGARTGAGAIWTPFRFLQKPASSDGEPSNTLSSQTDTNEHIHDSQKQLESGFDAETGTKTITIEQDPDTKDTTDRQELQTLGGMFKQERKASVVPEIRIMAPSLERGLDESAASLKHTSIDIVDSKEDIEDFEDDFTTRDHHILIEILIALWYAVLSNTDIVCYSVLFVKQVASSSILSLPLPFMVFLWGTLALPRPTKTFWVTLIAYTQAVVLLKCVFQFGVIWLNSPTPDYKNQQLSFSKLFEIEYRENYAAYDLVLLLVLFFHRFVLKSQGLWKSDYKKETIPEGDYVLKDDTEELGSSQEASETAVISKGDETLILAKQPENGAQSTSDIPIHVANIIEEPGTYLPEVVKITSAKYCSSLIDFFKDLIQKPRLPTDVYALLFLCDFINFFILLFGFASFGSQQGDGGVQAYLEENKIPIPFLIMLLLQFLLIIIDRALYLRKSLVYKVIFHFLSVIGIHIWMFFIIPAVTEAKFNSLLPPVIFYVIKCIYFLFSSYQIRCGYPTRILGNFLTKSYSLVNMIAYKLYMNIPFLFELRTFMDWVCTDTTMTLFDWLKMEDIFASIYGLKCGRQMESDLPSPRAQKKGLLVKIFMGGTAILSLIVIIWGPLALFALGNTVGIANIPYDVTVSLKVGPYEPVYQMSAQDTGIHAFDDNMMGSFYSTYTWNKSALTFVSGYDSDDVAAVVLGANSTALWNISPPDRERLLHDLTQNQTLTWRLKYTISRISHVNKDDPGVKQDEKTYLMDRLDPNRLLLLQMLEGNITTNESVILPRLLPKFIKVKNIGALKTVPQLMPENEELRNLKIRFFMGGYQNMDTWWEIKEDCDDDFYKNYLSKLSLSSCDSNVVIYTFNDKKFPSSVSLFTAGGIFGLYASIVYVISRVFRSVISGAHRSIMFEDLPYVDRVLQLCLDIYLVREAMEFSLEEDLFAKLLFLYRSPETMIKWTRPKEEATDDETEETESVRSRASSRRRPE